MSVFTSKRERRLWLWALAAVGAIYSTLGLAGALARVLHERNLVDATFILGLLLVGIAIVIQGLKRRPSGAEVGVAIGVAAAYLMVFVRMAAPEERSHLVEYSVVAMIIYEAFKERANQGGWVPVPAALAWITTIALGWIDEGIQSVLPGRVYDIRDVGFNALAGFLAIAASLALARARQLRPS